MLSTPAEVANVARNGRMLVGLARRNVVETVCGVSLAKEVFVEVGAYESRSAGD